MRVGAESSNRGGFTLIEVIAALVIFSLGCFSFSTLQAFSPCS